MPLTRPRRVFAVHVSAQGAPSANRARGPARQFSAALWRRNAAGAGYWRQWGPFSPGPVAWRAEHAVASFGSRRSSHVRSPLLGHLAS